MTGRIVLVTATGGASGSRAAAAAVACAVSEPDRAGLLIDVAGRPPRPTLVASGGARDLEERLARHLPQLRAASRGQTCHLAVPAEEGAFAAIAAAIPLARDSIAAIHLPARCFRDFLEWAGVEPTAVLLRADLPTDRALAALAVRDLAARGLRTLVLPHALAWMPSRRALFGLAQGSAGLPERLVAKLLSPLGREIADSIGGAGPRDSPARPGARESRPC